MRTTVRASVGRLCDHLLNLPAGRANARSQLLDAPETAEEPAALRRSVRRGSPFGLQKWVKRTAQRFGLSSTLRPRGRPRKAKPKRTSRPDKARKGS